MPWFAGQALGSVDPTTLITGGGGALGRIATQGALGGLSDLGYQALDKADEVIDKINPAEAFWSGLAAMGFQGALEGGGAAVKALKSDVPGVPGKNPYARPDAAKYARLDETQQAAYEDLLKTGTTDEIVNFFSDKPGMTVDRNEVNSWIKNGRKNPATNYKEFGSRRNATVPPGVRPEAMSKSDVESHVWSVTNDWKNKPDFEIVDNWKNIQDPAIKKSILQDKGKGDIIGFVGADGKVRILASAVKDTTQLNALIFHEGLGHVGLTKRFGQDLDDVMKTFYDNNDGELKTMTDKWIKDNTDAKGNKPYGGDIARAVDEVLAEASEKGAIDPGLMDVIKNKVKSYARDIGKEMPFSDREIITILGMAHQNVIHGSTNLIGNTGARFIRAWHGTPRSEPFNNQDENNPYGVFDDKYINSGEGGQAYGHGHYVAERRSLAEGTYRDGLSSRNQESNRINDQTPEQFYQDKNEEYYNKEGYDFPITETERRLFIESVKAGPEFIQRKIDSLKEDVDWWTKQINASDKSSYAAATLDSKKEQLKLYEETSKGFKKPGALYEIDLPDKGNWLEWDKEPSDKQWPALERLGFKRDQNVKTYLTFENVKLAPITGKDIYQNLAAKFMNDTGVSWEKAQEMTTKALQKEGFTGNKYLDGGSRSKGEGTYNYVIFDPKDAKIVNRYSRRRPGQATLNQSDVLDEFNIDDIVDSKDFKKALDVINTIRKTPKQSWEETDDLANDMAMSPKQAARARLQYTAEQMSAFKTTLDVSDKRVVDLEERINSGNSSLKDELDYKIALTTHVQLMDKFEGAKSQLGQSLNILRKIKAESNQLSADEIRAAMKEVGGALDSPENLTRFARQLAALRQAGGKNAANKLAKAVFKPKAEDYVFSLWYNALLSAPATHIANATGTAINFAADLSELSFASVLGQTRRWSPGADRVMGREVLARIGAIGMAMRDVNTWKNTYEAFKTGKTAGHVNSKTGSTNLVLPGPLTALETPTRALAAADEFARNVIQLSNIYGLAVRNAGKKGLRGKAFRDEVRNLINHPTQDMIDKTKHFSEVIQFLDKPSGVAKWFMQAHTSEYTPLRVSSKVVAPFLRTPDALIRTSIRRLGPLGMLERENIRGAKGDKAEQDIVKARIVMSSAFAATVALEALKGNITGSGPVDPKKNAEWQATHQPNSIKINGKWISIQDLQPVSTNVVAIATMVENADIASENSITNQASDIVLKTAQAFSDNTYTQNVVNFFEVLGAKGSSGSTKFANFAAGIANSAVPAVVRSYNQNVSDPVERDSTGNGSFDDRVSGRVMTAIPGQSQNLPQRYDVFGRARERQGNVGGMATRMKTQTEETDPTILEVQRLSGRTGPVLVGPPGNSVKVDGVKRRLNAEEFQSYQKKSGTYILGALKDRMAEKDWVRLSDNGKKAEIKTIVNDAREAARAKLFGEDE